MKHERVELAKLVAETDETFEAFKASVINKDEAETWTSKFAKDAEMETELHTYARMGREGSRYRHTTALIGKEDALTKEDACDLACARKGVVARRMAMFHLLSPAEQRGYSEKRT